MIYTKKDAYRDVYDCLSSWRRGYHLQASNFEDIYVDGGGEAGANAVWVDDVVNVVTLEDALMQITVRQREALFRHVVMDETQIEVAREMDISERRAGQLVDTGIRQLANILMPPLQFF